jgi:hypothetical protein
MDRPTFSNRPAVDPVPGERDTLAHPDRLIFVMEAPD